MLYGALVLTLWTCYGALQIVVLLLLLLRPMHYHRAQATVTLNSVKQDESVR